MSALVERIIAARDMLKARSHDFHSREVLDAMADAANALTERDETIHALRHRLAKVEAFSSVELMNCAHHVKAASSTQEIADRGSTLARMVLSIAE